jgi:import inner membrane translocase subunit TIM16
MAPLGPVARILVQTAVMGASILARAIPAAYGAALNNARRGGNDVTKTSSNDIIGRKRMTVSEAKMVLNVDTNDHKITKEMINKQFDMLFKMNSVDNGGSFYLQSKFYRAKELLDKFIKEKREEKSEH